MNVASDKAKALLHKYLVASHYSSHIKLMVDGDGFGEIREAVADCRAAQKELMDYIGELEAKPKWHTGHPEESGRFLVLRQNVYKGGCEGIARYEIARWDSKYISWFFDDDEPYKVGFERQALGWQEIEPFDLPIEPSETIGHLEEEEK